MINMNENKSKESLLDDNELSNDVLKAFDEPEVQEIGRTFLEARARKGFTQEQASKKLKVRTNLIADFENGKQIDLPGLAYQIGFVRSYASLVELDADFCVEAYKNSINIKDSRISYNFLESNKEKKSYLPIFVLASFLICLITYSGWYFNNLNTEKSSSENNLADFEEKDIEKNKINKTVNYVKIEGNASKKTSKPIVELKTPSGDIINDDLKIKVQQSTNKTRKEEQLEVKHTNSDIVENNEIKKSNIIENTNEISAIANERDPQTELVLKSSGNSWVEIEDLDGNSLVTRLMRSGETYVIPKNKGLTLSTGNAGVLSLVYGKIHIKSLGEIGEVISSRPLNIEAFKNRQN